MSIMRRIFTWLMSILILLALASIIYLQQPQFVAPRVEAPVASDHFAEGHFHNNPLVPVSTSDEGQFALFYRFLFQEVIDAIPEKPLPSKKTDLHALDPQDNVVVWMGHSTYFMQFDGKTYLIDPVFSDYASPVPGTNKAFPGTNIYDAEDIPAVDYLLISHDHWDHLDLPTLEGLKGKVGQVIAPLGVGSYLIQWGFAQERVFEGDWYDAFEDADVSIYLVPSIHFSGRLLTRNRTLWSGFAILTEKRKVLYSGDTGYGEHFKEIRERLGAFDLAILEDGQYNENWAHIHMSPEQAAQAAQDVDAKAVLAAHNSKFKLAHHAWYDPLERISQASEGQEYRMMTPLIGERVNLDDDTQTFQDWWRQR
ncbi:metal-dependent hydrolase [Marinomonas aquimarina]|uniref:Metal-dependent hydrolase n=1 Tax=Marinomonas aquimarina TaxID=295068 RepID=A0A1A8T810_9GAMM|nr:MBL fold metallo-hydrolase [Marinomonas aquimarina]SBS27596.1 metal-dependent hydrolase [Marinomonas aquimarina]